MLRAIAEDEPKYGLTPAVVASAQHAKIFGVVTVADRLLTSIFPPHFSSLGTPQRIVILLTVVVSATTTFMTVRQSMKRGMTPQVDPNNPMASSQKMMQYIVPVFALSGLYWQYGLVLYWVTTNLWTLGQQYVLFRRFPPPATAAAGAAGAAAASPRPAGGKSGARQPAKGAAKPAPHVTAAGRAAARQQAAAKAAPAEDGAGQGRAGRGRAAPRPRRPRRTARSPRTAPGPRRRPVQPRLSPASRPSTSCARRRPRRRGQASPG